MMGGLSMNQYYEEVPLPAGSGTLKDSEINLGKFHFLKEVELHSIDLHVFNPQFS